MQLFYDSAWEQLESVLNRFEELYEAGGVPEIDAFLTSVPEHRGYLLRELIALDLEYRIKRQGKPARIEEYLRRFPEIAHIPDAVVRLIGIEWQLRRGRGEPVAAGEYRQRFPEFGDQLESLTDADVAANTPEADRSSDATEAETLPLNSKNAVQSQPGTQGQPGTGDWRFPTISGYEVVGELGKGGMGIVYDALEIKLGRKVAIKVMASALGQNDRARMRFEREAQAVARLQHPHIVAIYAYAAVEDCPYLVLEFMEGGSLAQKIGKVPQPERKSAALVKSLASAMDYAHRQGIVHRDLKPANVLLTRDGLPKISDFGLACIMEGDTHPTLPGEVLGTPSYMSPEQAEGKGNVGVGSDVYSLGAILYEMVTGRPPFREASAAGTLLKVIHASAVSPRWLVDVSRDLDTIIMHCLEKNASRRYVTAGALADDLGRFLAGQAIHAKPPGAIERFVKWLRRERKLATACAAIVIAVATIVVLTLVHNRELTVALHNETKAKETAFEQSRIADEQRDQSETTAQLEALASARAALLEGRYPDVADALRRVPKSRRGWEWGRLQHQQAGAPRPIEVLGIHDWGILDAVETNDGRAIATTGLDGRVIVWDKTGGPPRELQRGVWSEAMQRWCSPSVIAPIGEPAPIDCCTRLCRSSDGQWLVGAVFGGDAADPGGKGIRWNLESGLLQELFSHHRPLFAVAASNTEKLLFGDAEGAVILYDNVTAQTHQLFLGPGPVVDVVWLPSGLWCVAQHGDREGRLSLVDADATRVLSDQTFNGPVWDLDVSPDGLSVAVAGNRISVFRVDAQHAALDLKEIYSQSKTGSGAYPAAYHAVRFSNDGHKLFGSNDVGQLTGWGRDDQSLLFVNRDQYSTSLAQQEIDRLPAALRRRTTAIVTQADSQTLYTTGLGTCLRRWTTEPAAGMTVFAVGSDPEWRFDTAEPRLAWIGSSDGQLTIVDSHTGERQDAVPAHAGRITGLDVAAERGIVATSGEDGRVRLWTMAERKIQELRAVEYSRPPVAPLKSIAISRDGARVASYDGENHVHLWEVASGRHIAGHQMVEPSNPSAVAGLIAFNPEGTQLAVAGPNRSLTIIPVMGFDSSGKQMPQAIAGEGATALAWHPRFNGAIASGDTTGRVYLPEDLGLNRLGQNSQHPIRGLSFSPEGDRLAVCNGAGRIDILDLRWIGETLVLQSPYPEPTGIHFDPTGARLAVAHRSGQMAIWESSSGDISVSPSQHRWKVESMLTFPAASDFRWNPNGVVLDEQDQVHMLYSIRAEKSENGETSPRRIVGVATETPYGAERSVLLTLEDIPVKLVNSVTRSFVLSNNAHMAIVRQPRPDVEDAAGQVLLYERHPTTWSSVRIGEPMNWGFDGQLLLSGNDTRTLLHFSHEVDRGLKASRAVVGGWETTTIGRLGDGFNLHAQRSSDGRIHVVCQPFRFNGDPSPLTYIRFHEQDFREEVREIIDVATNVCRDAMLALRPGQIPRVIYRRRLSELEYEIVVAGRDEAGWKQQKSIAMRSECWSCAWDRHGDCWVAWVDERSKELLLASYAGNKWTIESVSTGHGFGEPAVANLIDMSHVLLIDSRDRPMVVAFKRSVDEYFVIVIRSQTEQQVE